MIFMYKKFLRLKKKYDYSFETQNVSCPLFIFRQSITNDKKKKKAKVDIETNTATTEFMYV